MISIRPEAAADIAAIHAINAAAFGRDDEARLVDAVRQSEHFLPALSLVAMQNQEPVGHILFSRVHVRTPVQRVAVIALAPLAVRPDVQRRGVGSALVRYGLEACVRHGHEIVVVVGHPAYYPRFGFGSARARGLEAPFPVRDAAFMVCELRAGALDGVRGMIEYPPTFAGV